VEIEVGLGPGGVGYGRCEVEEGAAVGAVHRRHRVDGGLEASHRQVGGTFGDALNDPGEAGEFAERHMVEEGRTATEELTGEGDGFPRPFVKALAEGFPLANLGTGEVREGRRAGAEVGDRDGSRHLGQVFPCAYPDPVGSRVDEGEYAGADAEIV